MMESVNAKRPMKNGLSGLVQSKRLGSSRSQKRRQIDCNYFKDQAANKMLPGSSAASQQGTS